MAVAACSFLRLTRRVKISRAPNVGVQQLDYPAVCAIPNTVFTACTNPLIRNGFVT